MKTSDFDYCLPKKFIAQSPVSPRDCSKLMVYDTSKDIVYHKHFYDLIDFLNKDDFLVVNRSKVIPARIIFYVEGKEREIFILKNYGDDRYQVLVRPGRFFKKDKKFYLDDHVFGLVEEILEDGSRIIKFNSDIEKFGSMPLPPYINNKSVDTTRYQTVYAKEKGSVAAPTAGLHFTPELIAKIKAKGVSIEEVLLHVGRGTFLPVSTDNLSDHVMHKEWFEISQDTVKNLNLAKSENRRIIAVGTTSVRVLESSYDNGFVSKVGETDIFIYPGNYKWKAVDAIITNFHLPKSTLIMLIASFLENKGIKDPVKKILDLYELAKKNDYRFYSFGDAMFIF